jgi:predicted MFS family arabinose efflux permease
MKRFIGRKMMRIQSSTWFLTLLTAGYTFNQIDRQILGILIEPLKSEFLLSDTQLGLLTGIFTIAYIAVGLPLAVLADRHNRRNLLALCIAAWSGMTALCGLATSFTQLLAFRLMVGAGEAGGSPISLSLISDLYPPEKRAGAIGVYGMGTSIGALVSLALGGFAASLLGWRAAFFIVGLPGLLLAVLLFATTRDLTRGASEGRSAAQDPATLVTTLRKIWSISSLRNLVLALLLFATPYVGLLVWLPAFFIRTYDMSLSQAGLKLGLVIGIIGGLGSVLGGQIANRVRGWGLRYVPVYLGLTYIACAPFALLMLTAENSNSAFIFMSGWTLSSALGTGAQFALIQDLVGLRMRATVMAATGILMNFGAFFVGPQLIGILSDLMSFSSGASSSESASLQSAMLIVCSFYPFALFFTLLMAKTIRKDTDGAKLLP